MTARLRDIDRYNRMVAEIILPDGRNLNQEIVCAGFAGGIGNTRSMRASWRSLNTEREQRNEVYGLMRIRARRGNGGRMARLQCSKA